MTLVLTELSDVGIAMAADSAITPIIPATGKSPKGLKQQHWPKIVRVPSIKAAISYWGTIGILSGQKPFNEWLKEKAINSGNYADLDSFADHLTETLNQQCNWKLLKEGENIGLHLAGYAKWSDGITRPTFYHIHNGHGYIATIPQVDEQGNVIALDNRWITIARTLFEKHLDLPNPSNSDVDNLTLLKRGYVTRNGDFYAYYVIWDSLNNAFSKLNLMPHFSIPANPNNLGSRKDFLKMAVETIVRVYACSNHKQKPSIGGKVHSLAIGPNGYLNPIEDNSG
jgi:hypothetical protein